VTYAARRAAGTSRAKARAPGIAIDPKSGTVYVPGTLGTAFTSTVGPLQPGPFIDVFSPDPCDDGAGPLGSATGNPSDRGGQPTTWTCDPLGTPDSQCPAEPPAPLGTCPSGASCNYCLAGGRFFATCTAAGWATGYAQLLCE
jgi:hypothetical protein